jgi:hypothetical protein
MAMRQGHLDQVCMNSSSTQPQSPLPPVNPVPDYETSPPEPPTIRYGAIYKDCQCTTDMIYTDPTGKFLTPSVSGNQYVLIVYEYDCNYIYGAPMPDRTSPSIIAAYKTAIRLFKSRGLKPLLQRLDNKSSRALQTFMDEENIDFQLAPPQVHRWNAAERAMRTFKNYNNPSLLK